MPFAGPRTRLERILDGIREIEGFTAGKALQDYPAEGWLRLATRRGIEIISEASRHVPDCLKAEHPEIPWRDIAAVRRKYWNVKLTPNSLKFFCAPLILVLRN